jgi:hypothetical protein
MTAHIEFIPDAADHIADQLDAMADRLEQNMREARRSLALVPAAIDEVSRRAARTLNSVSASYQVSYADGVREVRKIAAQVRTHAHRMRRIDGENATLFAEQ